MNEEFTKYFKLIDKILYFHSKVSEEWKQFCSDNGTLLFNHSSCDVRNIVDNEDISNAVFLYQGFLLTKILEYNISGELESLGAVKCRTKARNSIENKIDRYVNFYEERGKSAIKKCLNDIFGVRIITNNLVTYEDIKQQIEQHYNKTIMRVINSSKPNENYYGTHIYFHLDNKSFDWELQVWYKENAEGNEQSHHKHKQQYTAWENEIKEGEGNEFA